LGSVTPTTPLQLTEQFGRVHYGADYNPDQWPRDVWDDDIALMREAGLTVVSLPIFSWVHLQPAQDSWDFEWLDDILDRLHAGGIGFYLATATASVPAWIDQRYPSVLRTGPDGRRVRHGERHTFCPSSPDFARLSTGLVRQIAQRYRDHPGLRLWHVGNEYGQICWCDLCAGRFRDWLRERYGSLDTLNARWNTAFWGHTYTDWSQLEPPYSDGESSIQALRVNWRRFTSDNLLGAYRAELAVLREITPDVPVTTNLMGAFDPLDYHRWAADLDVVSWDSYPRPHDPPATVAFRHALMRGLKGGQPFILMEQSPSQQNWQPYNWLKPPNVLRAQTFQAVAQGADGISYFQWRRSVAGIEKLHGAVVEHHGRSDARVFTEVARIGAELGALGTATLDGRMDAKVAVLFDWPNRWALDASSGPSVDLDYVDRVTAVFTALWELGIGCEVLSPHDDLTDYDVIVAPVLSMVGDDVAASLTTAARRGATVIGTAFTALVDDEDMVHAGGAPGPLRDLFGITVEEVDALPPDRSNAIVLGDREIGAGVLCERLFVEGAQVVGRYLRDFYADEPALTRNTVGSGAAFYVATLPSTQGWRELLTTVCAAHGIGSPLAGGAVPPSGVEVTRRIGPGGAVIYLINHNRAASVEVTLPAPCVDLVSRAEVRAAITLAPLDVRILREQ
jgi:beta-galactosidase